MLTILSDIHANLEALTACLAHAESHGAKRYAFLGDLVGYGADPKACLDIVRGKVVEGAIAIRGNHDEAALGGLAADMEPIAREAIVWTRRQLSDDERNFLAGLPYTCTRDDQLFVHASAERPADWIYLTEPGAAGRCLASSGSALIFAGHVHLPALYHSSGGRLATFEPKSGDPIPLSRSRRWLILAGSVGQPRDGNPKAAYMLFDEDRRQLTFHRVAYDWMAACRKIRSAGLPASLATRLEFGQ